MTDNDQLLKQIEKLFEAEREQTRKLVREEIKAERKETKKLIREEVKAVEKQLTTKIENVAMKVELVNQNIKAVDKKSETTKQEIIDVIERETKEISKLFQETWDRLDAQNERTARLEKRAGIPTSSKN